MKHRSLDSSVSIHSDIVSRSVQNEEVIVDLAKGIYYGLDEVGTYIWKIIQKQDQKISEIFSALVKEYDVNTQVAKQDLLTFIEALRKSQLIEVK